MVKKKFRGIFFSVLKFVKEENGKGRYDHRPPGTPKLSVVEIFGLKS
jgi:hypothetical protein